MSLFVDLAEADRELAPWEEVGPVDLPHVIADEIASALHPRPGARIELDCPVSGEASSVEADERRLRRVLANLLDNAIKYGGAPPEVSVRLEPADDGLLLAVGDNGPGISPAEQARVFERSFRGARASEHRGAGMGLYIARTLADQMGARISVQSEPGSGSTFLLWIPRLPPGSQCILPFPGSR